MCFTLHMDLGHLRENYETAGLDKADLAATPMDQFRRWFVQAQDANLHEPNAMTVISIDEAGWPQSRNVLLKAFDERGFVFYTNYQSAKAIELEAHPQCALTFSWLGLHRQIRVSGRAEHIPAEESDAYFASRPRGSQIGAWASPQSTIISSRETLDQAWAASEDKFAQGDVPRPPHWGGVLVRPRSIEFWQGRSNRLHDRLRYTPTSESDDWLVERLAP